VGEDQGELFVEFADAKDPALLDWLADKNWLSPDILKEIGRHCA
jgi:hypothetical protein